jgi:hypothetical protein
MHKLKVFGVALVALVALSAVLASAASATYRSPKKTVSLTGKSTTAQVFKTKFGTIECSSGEFTGTQTGEEEFEGEWTSKTITVHPTYTGCKALGFNATVNTEECKYDFTTATTTPGTGSHAVVHLKCPSGQKIHIVAAGGLCSVNVGEQENVGIVDFMNEGSGETASVLVDSDHVENISYEGVGGFCSGAGTGGTYTGKVSVTGTSGGESAGVKVLMGP